MNLDRAGVSMSNAYFLIKRTAKVKNRLTVRESKDVRSWHPAHLYVLRMEVESFVNLKQC